LKDLTCEDMESKLGIRNQSHRMVIMSAINFLYPKLYPMSPDSVVYSYGIVSPSTSMRESNFSPGTSYSEELYGNT